MSRSLRGQRLPTLPALDGIRAFAVLAVLLYHAEIAWMPGGFLGVEVFFVLSGYLITSLLYAEVREGGIGLRAFWARRARRLLPALFTMIVVTVAAFAIGWPEEVARARGDIAAAFGYVSNWYLIAGDHSYFTAFARPSPFRHLWSLAIEEQFYLVWPLALGGLAVWLRRRRQVAGVLLAGAAISAVTMWLLYQPDDPSRAYYGTDTRIAGLLLGACAALVWRPWSPEGRRLLVIPPRALDAATIGAAAFLAWSFWRFDEFGSFTYRPGIQLVALATVVLLAAAVHPSARLARALAWAPLRALGHRSYGIYLWHWPVFVVTRPGVDIQMSAEAALVLRLAITLVLAELSYRYVEEPFRRGQVLPAVERVIERVRRSPAIARRAAIAWGVVSAALFVGFTSLAGTVVGAADQASQGAVRPVIAPSDGASSTPASPRPVAASASPSPSARPAVEPIPATGPTRIAVGDSVMLGARNALRARMRPIAVHAGVARRTSDGLDILRRLRRQRLLGDVVIVHLGNNGPFRDWQFDEMMDILRSVEKVVIVTVKVPKRWERAVNHTIRAGVKRHPRVELVDWRAEWRSCGGRVFTRDAVHLTSKGARCYARLIAARL